nr:hypothetical protein CK203_005488 [Ipomoea batatas]
MGDDQYRKSDSTVNLLVALSIEMKKRQPSILYSSSGSLSPKVLTFTSCSYSRDDLSKSYLKSSEVLPSEMSKESYAGLGISSMESNFSLISKMRKERYLYSLNVFRIITRFLYDIQIRSDQKVSKVLAKEINRHSVLPISNIE